MDLQDQLKNLFPDHEASEVSTDSLKPKGDVPLQQEPLVCKYEKRKGKATTLIEGFMGTEAEFKILVGSMCHTSLRENCELKEFSHCVLLPITHATIIHNRRSP